CADCPAFGVLYHLSAKRLRDNLVAKADADHRHMFAVGLADELFERGDKGMIRIDAMARAGQKPALRSMNAVRKFHVFHVIAGKFKAPSSQEPLEHGVIVALVAAKLLRRLATFENADTHDNWPVDCPDQS